ncbi:unnamed protein product [Rodentolepis nana]|uniref:CUB domain-containing protein n=1 Tax=Rodentolepis nana TaxID=102285 RepID=A0A0R3TZ79_RODNA|nr:unnamed protein product [Rodentolepis nana]
MDFTWVPLPGAGDSCVGVPGAGDPCVGVPGAGDPCAGRPLRVGAYAAHIPNPRYLRLDTFGGYAGSTIFLEACAASTTATAVAAYLNLDEPLSLQASNSILLHTSPTATELTLGWKLDRKGVWKEKEGKRRKRTRPISLYATDPHPGVKQLHRFP